MRSLPHTQQNSNYGRHTPASPVMSEYFGLIGSTPSKRTRFPLAQLGNNRQASVFRSQRSDPQPSLSNSTGWPVALRSARMRAGDESRGGYRWRNSFCRVIGNSFVGFFFFIESLRGAVGFDSISFFYLLEILYSYSV